MENTAVCGTSVIYTNDIAVLQNNEISLVV